MFYSPQQSENKKIGLEQLNFELDEFCRAKMLYFESVNINLKTFIKSSYDNFLANGIYKRFRQIKFKELLGYKNSDIKQLDLSKMFKYNFSIQTIDENIKSDICFDLVKITKCLTSYTSFCKQYKVSINSGLYNSNPVIIKKYKSINPGSNSENALNDDFILNELSSNASLALYFPKYYGSCTNYNSYILVMDYYEYDLRSFIISLKIRGFKHESSFISGICKQLLESFAFMAQFGIIHRNVRLENILINKDWKIGIIGFDISIKNYKGKKLALPLQGTLAYMAPELAQIYNHENKTFKYNPELSDVFSLGVVLLSIFLLEDVTEKLKINYQSRILVSLIDNVEFGWARYLLNSMLNSDPDRRPNFSQIQSYLPDSRSCTPPQ